MKCKPKLEPKDQMIKVDDYSQHDNSELRYIHPLLLRSLGEIPEKRIVDYGCGEGKLVKILSDMGARVHGFDICEDMISKAKQINDSSVILNTIKSAKIPLKDNSIDAVVSNLVLMMCQNFQVIEAIHFEINRILMPEGIWTYCVTHPAFTHLTHTTYRNIFFEKRDYNWNGQPYQFVLRKTDGLEITNKSFIDYHYSIGSYLNLLPKMGFIFEEMIEITVPGNEVPQYMIIKSTKQN